MTGKIGSMVLVAGMPTPRVYSWALRREKVAKRENIRMADCMIFPERILASNVPASW